MQILIEQIRKANKEHRCDACYWWDRSNYGEQDVTPDEWKVIESAQQDGWKIVKGQKYLFQSFVYDGMIQTFKGRLDIDEICKKYDLYPEEE